MIGMLGEQEDRTISVGGKQGYHGGLLGDVWPKLSVEGNINDVLEREYV